MQPATNKVLPLTIMGEFFVELLPIKELSPKSIKRRVLTRFFLLLAKTLLFLVYLSYVKEGKREYFAGKIEKKFFQLLEEGRVSEKEELLKLAQFMAPFWSKGLKETLLDAAEEAYETFLLKKELENNQKILANFVSKIKI